jgi:inosose dehydratase
MIEPPFGVPDLAPILAMAEKLDTDLFAIVEQDLYPCDPGDPLPIAARTCKYLRQLGVGSDGR